MDCPRCGAFAVSTPECPRCGVILAKARARAGPAHGVPPRRTSPGRLAGPRPPRSRPRARRRRGRRPPASRPGAARRARPREPRAPAPTRPPAATTPCRTASRGRAASSDRAATRGRGRRPARGERPPTPTGRPRPASRIACRHGRRSPPEDVRAAEDLFGRYPVPARDLLEGVLIGAAGRPPGRAPLRRRGGAPRSGAGRGTGQPPAASGRSSACWLETGDWASAESAGARRCWPAPLPTPEAARGLAYALVRQDRSREAIDAAHRLPRPAPRPGDARAPGAVPARPGLGRLTRRGAPRPLPRALRRRRARGRRP